MLFACEVFANNSMHFHLSFIQLPSCKVFGLDKFLLSSPKSHIISAFSPSAVCALKRAAHRQVNPKSGHKKRSGILALQYAILCRAPTKNESVVCALPCPARAALFPAIKRGAELGSDRACCILKWIYELWTNKFTYRFIHQRSTD